MNTSQAVTELIAGIRRAVASGDKGSKDVDRPPILGALIALLQCRTLIENNWELLKKRKTFDRRGLVKCWDELFDEHAHVRWQNADFCLWGIGHHLNRAQAASAASLDRLINLILCYVLGISSKEAGKDTALTIFSLPPTVRVELLCLIGRRWRLNSTVLRKVKELGKVKEYIDTGIAEKLVKKELGLEWDGLEAIFERVRRKKSGAECAMAVFGRNNAYKHQIAGSFREGAEYLNDWAVTAVALMWIGSFWEAFAKERK